MKIRDAIRKFFPSIDSKKQHQTLNVFGEGLQHQSLWHLNKRSVSSAFAVGLFCAFLPIPFQMVLAAALAIIFAANLPISITLVWITNPITMPAIFYFAYTVGNKALNIETKITSFNVSLEWFFYSINSIWEPLLLGSLILSMISSVVGYFFIRLYWRYYIVSEWRARIKSRLK